LHLSYGNVTAFFKYDQVRSILIFDAAIDWDSSLRKVDEWPAHIGMSLPEFLAAMGKPARKLAAE